MFELQKEDIDLLIQLNRHPGWSLYQTLVKEKFDTEYARLRKSRKSDNSFARTNGVLDGLELALKLVDELIEENQE